MFARMKAGRSRSNAERVSPFSRSLSRIRRQIDRVDAEMVALIAKRAALTQCALTLKVEHGACLHCPRREQEILDRVKALAAGYGIDSLAVERIFMLLLRQYVGPDSVTVAGPMPPIE